MDRLDKMKESVLIVEFLGIKSLIFETKNYKRIITHSILSSIVEILTELFCSSHYLPGVK